VRSFVEFTLHEILFRHQIKEGVMGGARSKYRREKKCIQDFGRKLEGKRPFRRPKRSWENNIRMNLHEIRLGGRLDWGHRIGTSGGLLQRHSRSFGLDKMQGISCLAVEIIASQERTCFTQ
jgi:hypothetical protein